MNEKRYLQKCDEVLIDSIDEALSSLGEKAKEVIYLHLERNHGITKQNLPKNVAGFSDALEKILGAGARQLEILIMQKLHRRVDCLYKWQGPKWLVPDLTFVKYVELVMLHFQRCEKKESLEMMVFPFEKQERKI